MRLFQFLIPSLFTNWLTPTLGTAASVVGIAGGVKNLVSGGGGGGGGGGGSAAPSGGGNTNITNNTPMPSDLTPGITVGIPVPIHLAGEFSPNPQLYSTDTKSAAEGGYISQFDNLYANGGPINPPHNPSSVGLGSLINPPPNQSSYSAFAEGGDVEHNPEFYSEGGLKNTYVKGSGDGTSDSVPAMLANGEFVIPADIVSALGNGSSDSGSLVLDEFLKVIRDHKANHAPDKLPPDSKGALTYLSLATKKVK